MALARLRVHEKWLEFREVAVPRPVSHGQLQDLRRAYYAGAEAVLNGVILPGLPAGSDAEPAAGRLLNDVQEELRIFAGQVKAGAA